MGGRSSIATDVPSLGRGPEKPFLALWTPPCEPRRLDWLRTLLEHHDPPSFRWTPMLAFRSWRGVSDERYAPGVSGGFQTGGG